MISSSINVDLPMKIKHFLFDNTISYLQYLIPVYHSTVAQKDSYMAPEINGQSQRDSKQAFSVLKKVHILYFIFSF